MTGIVVEYARFLEVRQRRARVAEAFISRPPEITGPISPPTSVEDCPTEPGATPADATFTTGAVDICANFGPGTTWFGPR